MDDNSFTSEPFPEELVRKRNPITFGEAVLAVIIGSVIFDWIKSSNSYSDTIAWLVPAILVFLVAREIWAVHIQHRREKRWWKKRDQGELEFVRSKGYESWAEYMVDHGLGEDVRESWKEVAAKEKKKRRTISKK